MSTVYEIQEAIRHLAPADRKAIAVWLSEIEFADHYVREPAPAYGAAREQRQLTIEEYFEIEEHGPIRHEYIAGEIYAMSGVSLEHSLICGNVFNTLYNHLRGGPCRAFTENFKVCLRLGAAQIFYYPDVMVACGNEGYSTHSLSHPKLIVEVLSPSTERIDRQEKAANYRQAPSLEEYVLIAQNRPEVTIHRRSEGWQPIVIAALEAAAELRSIGLSLPLARIYEEVLGASRISSQ